ncbi:MAG: tRNA uridine-5-carboxymethylaminomethyl(34) synthesis enzyme MnmG [Planctomycetes bacterium]|nr:tRNA uridine-5-carboxymethylaminomethyl(34) synthesis enzyme MnmG [Planctomycetota bacterium]
MSQRYDIIVIGGGHAGVEAAWAASRLAARTALVTMQYEAIGRMSCNPAIGGLGKGHMVREIDALGGLMGLATDRAGIQFRMLNRSKGPAVWAPRAQCDRKAYPKAVQTLLASATHLDVVEGLIETIVTQERSGEGAAKRVCGVLLKDGRRLHADVVILTTGTFLRALMHCGPQQSEGGRVGEPSAVGLSACLKALGFTLGRLKTGTPPRVHRDTVDFEQCEVQPGDDVPIPFSAMTDAITQPQVNCWITWTNARVHEPIRANLHRAPMYSGQIQSRGPRYCPSIEDKIVRFADKPRHQIFLEPEGTDDERIYCNGISTSLPQDVQDAFLREVPGLQHAKILQYGYAVEYDFVPTHQTRLSLETKLVSGLFLAGQINGTSGYEEAAGQGVIAGINAVRSLQPGTEPFTLGRDQAYLGVMIDDIITRPPPEPYRMFTSRAEYRLLLRSDNADERLTPIGRELGLVDDARWKRFSAKDRSLTTIRQLCRKNRFEGVEMETWLRRPDVKLAALAEVLARITPQTFCADAVRQVLVEAKYSGYVDRQAKQIERFRRLESLAIPLGTDYGVMTGLRHEARERLGQVAPATLGQASRISGISPADITTLWIYLTGRRATRTSA